jgi:hypothetical protein
VTRDAAHSQRAISRSSVPHRSKSMTETKRTSSRPLVEGRALLAAIDQLPPDAPTACGGWTAHHIAAHLAAGAKETADLIDERLDGRPDRPTRPFEEREAPFRAMSHDELRARLVAENVRKMAAWDALAEQTADSAITFTGTRITVDELETHSRSEAALHRWDLVGDDDTSGRLLAQPELTAHAVKVLNRMPVLTESARSLGVRAVQAGLPPLRLVFRSPDQPDEPDVVLVVGRANSHFELADRPVGGDITLTTGAGNRLLVLWGRRSTSRSIAIEGSAALVAALDRVVWPNAKPWPGPMAPTSSATAR